MHHSAQWVNVRFSFPSRIRAIWMQFPVMIQTSVLNANRWRHIIYLTLKVIMETLTPTGKKISIINRECFHTYIYTVERDIYDGKHTALSFHKQCNCVSIQVCKYNFMDSWKHMTMSLLHCCTQTYIHCYTVHPKIYTCSSYFVVICSGLFMVVFTHILQG